MNETMKSCDGLFMSFVHWTIFDKRMNAMCLFEWSMVNRIHLVPIPYMTLMILCDMAALFLHFRQPVKVSWLHYSINITMLMYWYITVDYFLVLCVIPVMQNNEWIRTLKITPKSIGTHCSRQSFFDYAWIKKKLLSCLRPQDTREWRCYE